MATNTLRFLFLTARQIRLLHALLVIPNAAPVQPSMLEVCNPFADEHATLRKGG